MKRTEWLKCAALAVACVLFGKAAAMAQQDALLAGGPQFTAEPQFTLEPLEHEELQEVLLTLTSSAEGEEPRSEYRLGVHLAALPEVAKKHLALEDGLTVEEVTADSPAAKAEIRKYDILLKAGDTPLKTMGDLIKVLEASHGKEITITIVREGKNQTVKVTPDKRPASESVTTQIRKTIEARRPELAQEIKQFEEALERLKAKIGKEGVDLWFAKPAIVAPKVDVKFPARLTTLKGGPFPKDLSVQINKDGDRPAKIKVKRGDNEEWEVTDDALKDLPDDVRPYVERLMGNLLAPGMKAEGARMVRVSPEGKIETHVRVGPAIAESPLAPTAPVPPKPPAAPRVQVAPQPVPPQGTRGFSLRTEREIEGGALEVILKKLDERGGAVERLEKKIEDLRKEIDELRTKK